MFLKMQSQLQSLMETLNSTEPHYIRCVKPNNVLKPAIFENLNIIQQLRCGVSILYSFFVSFYIIEYRRSNAFGICLHSMSVCLIVVCFRVFLRQLESAVLDILREGPFMNSLTDLVFFSPKFWMESKAHLLVTLAYI